MPSANNGQLRRKEAKHPAGGVVDFVTPVAPNSNTTVDVRPLSAAIRRGDEDAFAQFYELYSRRLYGLLLFLASGHEETARDVLQATMIKVARKFPVFKCEAELWAWLSQVARNALIDHIRKQARRPDHISAELLGSSWVAQESGDQELLVWLETGLNELSSEEQALVESVYFERQQQQHLAETNGTTRKAIESKLARIRAKLRQFILQRIKDERRTNRV